MALPRIRVMGYNTRLLNMFNCLWLLAREAWFKLSYCYEIMTSVLFADHWPFGPAVYWPGVGIGVVKSGVSIG